MCGYCIEAGVVLDFVANEKYSNNQELENNWISIYLQETTRFPGIIGKLKNFDNFPGSIDVAFCRLWEVFLYQEHTNIYDFLTNEYGAKAINGFLDGLKKIAKMKNGSYSEIMKYIQAEIAGSGFLGTPIS